ncbi:hypothetical protein KSP40_PGU014647 [Platanthera guangdongensis]|uniref:Uncharacterized protein n=1 Tax=Platanthera guangdongensis TaxID=2320717 RepID=A0ABR2N3Q3_9ASPA
MADAVPTGPVSCGSMIIPPCKQTQRASARGPTWPHASLCTGLAACTCAQPRLATRRTTCGPSWPRAPAHDHTQDCVRPSPRAPARGRWYCSRPPVWFPATSPTSLAVGVDVGLLPLHCSHPTAIQPDAAQFVAFYSQSLAASVWSGIFPVLGQWLLDKEGQLAQNEAATFPDNFLTGQTDEAPVVEEDIATAKENGNAPEPEESETGEAADEEKPEIKLENEDEELCFNCYGNEKGWMLLLVTAALFVSAFRYSVLGKRRRKEGKQMNLRRRLLRFHPPVLRNAPKKLCLEQLPPPSAFLIPQPAFPYPIRPEQQTLSRFPWLGVPTVHCPATTCVHSNTWKLRPGSIDGTNKERMELSQAPYNYLYLIAKKHNRLMDITPPDVEQARVFAEEKWQGFLRGKRCHEGRQRRRRGRRRRREAPWQEETLNRRRKRERKTFRKQEKQRNHNFSGRRKG